MMFQTRDQRPGNRDSITSQRLSSSLFTQQGVTLIELLIAATISIVIILAIGQLDVTRILLTQQVSQTSTTQSEASVAVAQMTKQFERVDRMNLLSTGETDEGASIQARYIVCQTPGDPACFDDPTSYHWAQYRHVDTNGDGTLDAIRFYDNTQEGNCSAKMTFHAIQKLVVRYKDEAQQSPPGGEPSNTSSGQDNNVLELTVTSTEPVYTYTAEVTVRAIPYTDLQTGLQAPAGNDLSPPPTPSC